MENADRTLSAEQNEPTESAEPTEPIDRIDPAEPMERIEPEEPIERMLPAEATLRIEPADSTELSAPTDSVELTDRIPGRAANGSLASSLKPSPRKLGDGQPCSMVRSQARSRSRVYGVPVSRRPAAGAYRSRRVPAGSSRRSAARPWCSATLRRAAAA